MFREKNKIVAFYLLIEVILIFFSFALPYLMRFNHDFFPGLIFKEPKSPNQNQYLLFFCVWGLALIFSLKRKNLYYTDRAIGILEESYRVFASLLTVSIFVAAVIFFTQFKFFSRFIFMTSFGLLAFFLISWRILKRMLLRQLIKKGFHNFNVLIVGNNEMTPYLLEEIKRNPLLGLKVVGIMPAAGEKPALNLPVLGYIEDFENICKKYFIDEVIVSTATDSALLSKIAGIAKNLHLGIRAIPFNLEDAPSSLSIHYLGIVPLLTYKERDFHPSEFFVKRAFDVLFSLISLIILSPVFLMIGLFILLDDGMPVFYIQKRMGRKGEIFNFYKFRSMIKDADSVKHSLMSRNEVKSGIIFKIRKDPRVTRTGRFLRRYSLDELPQLLNVLKGNMSLVGPRPFPVSESEKIGQNYARRLTIRPGISGLAQIRGRSDLPFAHWMKWDLWYINNWTFGIDLKILWWTFATVFKGKGAY